jgi:hypothetical protein
MTCLLAMCASGARVSRNVPELLARKSVLLKTFRTILSAAHRHATSSSILKRRIKARGKSS